MWNLNVPHGAYNMHGCYYENLWSLNWHKRVTTYIRLCCTTFKWVYKSLQHLDFNCACTYYDIHVTNLLLKHEDTVIHFTTIIVIAVLPYGVQSVNWNVQLGLTINNLRSETVYVWWVDYLGNAVYYGAISPSSGYLQNSYGTHPWIIAKFNGDIISMVTGYTANMQINIE